MPTVARGKALVAKLWAQPGVRDAEALAAHLGRLKRLRKSGVSAPDAKKADAPKKRSKLADIADEYDGSDEPGQTEEEKYEERLLKRMEKEERSRLYQAIQEAGGLQTRDDLREEYSQIPNTYKRRDGMPGDEMAEYLDAYFPEYGVRTERDLIDFLAA